MPEQNYTIVVVESPCGSTHSITNFSQICQATCLQSSSSVLRIFLSNLLLFTHFRNRNIIYALDPIFFKLEGNKNILRYTYSPIFVEIE